MDLERAKRIFAAAGGCIGVYMGPRTERGEGEEQGHGADDYGPRN